MLTGMERDSLKRYAWLSIAAALATMLIKTAAWLLTGSVGLLSDAVESIVNLVGGIMALTMLTIAARPVDAGHPYGHSKAEYFSSGVEGTLILIAAVSIAWAAVQRLITPRVLEQVGLGLGVSVVASVINLVVAMILLRVGRKNHSITLEANARHLMTDVWTSGGVLVGVGLVAITGWQRLDPIVAILVAGNIVYTGFHIVSRSVQGLMDAALPAGEEDAIRKAVEKHVNGELQYHALKTRQSGARRFVTLHVLVPGTWTVHAGHELLEVVEKEVRSTLPRVTIFTHLESLDDPRSWDDIDLDRAMDE